MTPLSFTREELDAAAALVHTVVPPTPAIWWPLLAERCGCDVVVKHENHSPVGAFKLRGGVVYLTELHTQHPEITGVITATRGNHGQSVATAARSAGLTATVVVPHGNSTEKNAAMRAQGATLIEHGRDFQESYEHAMGLAEMHGYHFVPSFGEPLVRGVATASLELFRAAPDLDALYVPVGMGSGICAALAARDALGLSTPIIGVVAEQAPCYALSFEAGTPIPTESARTVADGLGVRVPHPDALARIREGAERIVTVSEDDILDAMRAYFTDTHNVIEGAGAAPLAALLQDRTLMQGKRVGLIASGGNVDRDLYARVLAGGDASAFTDVA